MRSYEADSTQMLNELQASHPYDETAIKQHNELAEKRHATRDVLENHTRETNDSDGWRWSLVPWPWNV